MSATPLHQTDGGRTVRTCLDLGVCQARTPACPGCAHQAPQPTPQARPTDQPDDNWLQMLGWLKAGAIACSLFAVTGFLAGVGTGVFARLWG